MPLDYQTYEEAREKFQWSERWELFAGNKERFNVADECIERHDKKEIALRLKFADHRSEIYTFADLSRLTSQFANHLERMQVSFGERVAVLVHPSLEFYTSMFGIYKRGAVLVPLSPLFGPEAVEFRIADSQASALVTTRENAKLVNPELIEKQRVKLIYAEDLLDDLKKEGDSYEAKTSAKDLCTLGYSSGTTGVPKAIRYTHDAITVVAVIMKISTGLKPMDTYFCPASPTWGHGIWYGTIAPLIFGKAVGNISGRYDPELCFEALEEFGATNMTGIASHFRLLMDSGVADRYKTKIRIITYAGEAMSKQTVQQLIDTWGIAPHVQYGSTEAGPVCVDYGGFDEWVAKPGSLGKPMIGGIKVAIIDDDDQEVPPGQEGQIAIWRRDHWLRVGDLGYADGDGYYWHLGRADDIIISAGYTIGPLEIEQSLSRHPAIEECAVVGSPDQDRGQVVKAFIMLREGHSPTEDLKRDIQDFVKDKLSKHEYPREVEFIAELPKTVEGKLKRKVLKDLEKQRKAEKESRLR